MHHVDTRFIAVALSCLFGSAALAEPVKLEDPILPNAAGIAEVRLARPAVSPKKIPLAAPQHGPANVPAGAASVTTIEPEALSTLSEEEPDSGAAWILPPEERDSPAARSGGTLGDVREPKVHTLEIGLQIYDLAYVGQTFDEKYALRHITLRVVDQPESFARFSVSLDGLVVGTLQTPGATYRIIPLGRGRQAVYRLQGNTSERPLRYARIAPPSASQHVRRLENRHVQLEQLADIRPDLAMSSERGGTLNLIGGRLGQLANTSHKELTRTLERFADLAYASRPSKVRISRISGGDSGRRIEFEQLIGNIPVSGGSVIRTAADGTILEISTRFVDPARAANQPIIGLRRAMQLAEAALEARLAKSLGSVELVNPAELRYHSSPSLETLLLEYRFDLATAQDGNWMVLVDAYTGSAQVIDPRQFSDVFGYLVCRDISSTQHPLTCTSGGAEIMWTNPLGGNPNCSFASPMGGNNPCLGGEVGPSHTALLHVNGALLAIHLADPAFCCDLIGGSDRTVDLIYNTSGSTQPSAYYEPTTQSLVSGSSDLGFQSIEVVWHEFGHHVLHMYNPEIQALYNQHPFASAFNEGFADTFSNGVAEARPTLAGSTGDPWIHGDGILFPYGTALIRDCKDPNISFQTLELQTTPHARGRAICVFFNRIQETSGITPQRLLELLLEVGDRMQDYDGNGLDLIDLKNALHLSIEAGETALRNAMETEFADMYEPVSPDPPPLPPGQPAPEMPPPPSISASFHSCSTTGSGQPSTRWLVQWAPVPEASAYIAYLKKPFEPWPSDTALTQQTSLIASIHGISPLTLTWATSYAFVRSCNANGCGHSSNQVLLQMLPGCSQ